MATRGDGANGTAAILLACLTFAPAAAAAQGATPAGTVISNTAAVSWTAGGEVRRTDSNTVSVIVEALDAASLVKSQQVRAPDGSARPVSGAVVTYTLAARFPGGATGARIDDPVPAGTAYLPGSLLLDGAALTDAADGDPGTVDVAGVAVLLGDVAPAGTRTVTFQVRLP